MSSGFVPEGTAPPEPQSPPSQNDSAWIAARNVLAAASAPPPQDLQDLQDQKSLYEILQSNKARKQEEIEEKLKFKNQFKPLDESDVDFLDSVVEGERRAEAARRREIEQSLDEFRRQQSEVERPEMEEEEVAATGAGWKKRKRRKMSEDGEKAKAALGLKVRRKSSVAEEEAKEDVKTEKPQVGVEKANIGEKRALDGEKKSEPATLIQQDLKPKDKPKASALVDYGSDDSD